MGKKWNDWISLEELVLEFAASITDDARVEAEFELKYEKQALPSGSAWVNLAVHSSSCLQNPDPILQGYATEIHYWDCERIQDLQVLELLRRLQNTIRFISETRPEDLELPVAEPKKEKTKRGRPNKKETPSSILIECVLAEYLQLPDAPKLTDAWVAERAEVDRTTVTRWWKSAPIGRADIQRAAQGSDEQTKERLRLKLTKEVFVRGSKSATDEACA